MTRVLITGCRDWFPLELVDAIVVRLVARYGDDLVVVHGDCSTGIDLAFRMVCNLRGVQDEPHPAAWGLYGKAAGPRRNAEMVDLGAAFCISMHRNLRASAGTGDCVRKAIKAGIPVWHYYAEGSRRDPHEGWYAKLEAVEDIDRLPRLPRRP